MKLNTLEKTTLYFIATIILIILTFHSIIYPGLSKVYQNWGSDLFIFIFTSCALGFHNLYYTYHEHKDSFDYKKLFNVGAWGFTILLYLLPSILFHFKSPLKNSSAITTILFISSALYCASEFTAWWILHNKK